VDLTGRTGVILKAVVINPDYNLRTRSLSSGGDIARVRSLYLLTITSVLEAFRQIITHVWTKFRAPLTITSVVEAFRQIGTQFTGEMV
jgi:hypothetical protein